MPTLDFKGKQFIYGHHLTVPIRTLETDTDKSLYADYPPRQHFHWMITLSSMATTCTP